jgi:hypothetical protein
MTNESKNPDPDAAVFSGRVASGDLGWATAAGFVACLLAWWSHPLPDDGRGGVC